ncbi:hypothetical protein GCM10009646_34760 [Streptomyces aureus]
MNVVVGYATAHGLAREIAQRLATRLTASGVSARPRPMGEVLDAAVFEVFVPGSAIHERARVESAKDFLSPPLSVGVDVPSGDSRHTAPWKRLTRKEGSVSTGDLTERLPFCGVS